MVYAQISILSPEHFENTGEIDQFSRRAWFDECIIACRRRDLDDGRWWTRAAFLNDLKINIDPNELTDSYRGDDDEILNRQQDRDKSLTLKLGLLSNEAGCYAEDSDEVELLE